MFARIRRSLKPKRLVFVSAALGPLVEQFGRADLGCELIVDGSEPFALDDPEPEAAEASVERLREVLSVAAGR
jgi:hypothetical protein